MAPSDVRERFLATFVDAGFRRSPPLSLVQPSIKTSFLFSVGFVDVLEAIAGQTPHLDGAATIQRCFRHFDVERVSDSTHLSLFEMAGVLKCTNWSHRDLVVPLIRFFVRDCGISENRLHVTYFGGGNVSGQDFPPDDAARDAYAAAGISPGRIWAGKPDTNIWFEGANSGTPRSGICGPHSEVFYDLAPDGSEADPLTHPTRFLEVSNIVTITHRANTDADISPLPLPLIEMALGMERLEMVLAGVSSVHDTPKLAAITSAVVSSCSSDAPAQAHGRELRIAVDHVRALTHLIADGGRPGPKGRGHVLRRLLRELIRVSAVLNLDVVTALPELTRSVAGVDAAINSNLSREVPNVTAIIEDEILRMQGGLEPALA